MDSIPSCEPTRLVLMQPKCFYCSVCNEDTIQLYRIYHQFGILHCPTHADAAIRDGEKYMRFRNMVRKYDALEHPVLRPFVQLLSSNVPVLRTSGAVETHWSIQTFDEKPFLERSWMKGWGCYFTDGEYDKFVSFAQFQDPRISSYVNPDVLKKLDEVIALLEKGMYLY